MALKKTAVFSADTNRLYAKRFYQCNQFFIYFCKNHFRNLHRILVCHTKTIDETRLHSYLVYPAADFLAAAVNDDRFKPDQFQKNNILDHICLESLINHCTSAVFYHHDLTVKTLNIRKCLDKCFCLVQIFLIYHFSFLLDSIIYNCCRCLISYDL